MLEHGPNMAESLFVRGHCSTTGSESETVLYDDTSKADTHGGRSGKSSSLEGGRTKSITTPSLRSTCMASRKKAAAKLSKLPRVSASFAISAWARSSSAFARYPICLSQGAPHAQRQAGPMRVRFPNQFFIVAPVG